MRRLLFSTLLLLPAAWTTPVVAAPAAIAGRWVGAEIVRNEGFGLTAGRIFFRLAPVDGGFSLAWNVPGAVEERVLFEATERSGVYAASRPGRKLLGLFNADEGIDPLAGDPLVWARLAGDALVVYRMTIDDHGAFMIDRCRVERKAGSLLLRCTRRIHGEGERALEARLEREVGSR